MGNYAIIDLGSNTFHLLIISTKPPYDGFSTLFKSRAYVKLASGGKSYIDDTAWRKAFDCLEAFSIELKKYQVTSIKAIGTAMLRKADNAKEFIEEVHKRFGIQIEVIEGSQEAHYILKGVKYAVPQKYVENSLILDIGGGSVECIVMNEGRTIEIKSYPIGIAILKKRFHNHDPISTSDISAMESFLGLHLDSMISVLKEKNINTIIGCSGTFEVLFEKFAHATSVYAPLSIERSLEFIKEITELTFEDRLVHHAVPKERADLIVVALLLIRWFLKKNRFDHLIYSPYAMKEGAIADLKLVS